MMSAKFVLARTAIYPMSSYLVLLETRGQTNYIWLQAKEILSKAAMKDREIENNLNCNKSS